MIGVRVNGFHGFSTEVGFAIRAGFKLSARVVGFVRGFLRIVRRAILCFRLFQWRKGRERREAHSIRNRQSVDIFFRFDRKMLMRLPLGEFFAGKRLQTG